MNPARTLMNRQRKSREALASAAARYVGLRLGGGFYEDTVRTIDRAGRPVTVLVRLDILSEETIDER